MKTITLTKGGLIASGNRAPDEIDPIQLLGDQVILAQGYCLRSFFQMIETYPLLERLSEFFPGELKQYREIVANASTYSETTGIEFGKTIEMVGFPGNPRLEIYASLRITGSDPSLKVRSVGLSGLLDVPIALGRLRHIVFGDRVDVLEFETTYTFFEFIDGIAWELGFLTTPGECQIGR